MQYYKNRELAELHSFSIRTVLKWIEQTRNGRLDLELYQEGDKFYVAKTSKNQLILKRLAQERRKYFNRQSLKTATPTDEFYKAYSEEQILDIIDSIDVEREIPRQYNYFNGGAQFWDKYAQRLESDEAPNLLTRTIELLDDNSKYLDKLLDPYARVNVIDIGVGNAVPAKGLIAHLLKTGKLSRYAAIDISQEMLDIAGKNIDKWFNQNERKVRFEGYVDDISYEPFKYATAVPPASGPMSTVNLVLLLGGTLSNFRAPGDVLKVIRKSMGRNDLFIYTVKLDSVTTREQFDFRVSGGHSQGLPPQYKFIVDLLGIDESDYTVEMGFNDQERARYLQIRLKHALTIDFRVAEGHWSVDLHKDDALVVWRAQHNSARDIQDLFWDNGFNPLLVSQSADHDYMMVIADRRRKGL